MQFTLVQAMKAQTEWRYNSTLSVTLDGGEWSSRATAALTTGKTTGTLCTGDWMDLRAGLDGCGKSCFYRVSIIRPSISYKVAVPTTQRFINSVLIM